MRLIAVKKSSDEHIGGIEMEILRLFIWYCVNRQIESSMENMAYLALLDSLKGSEGTTSRLLCCIMATNVVIDLHASSDA